MAGGKSEPDCVIKRFDLAWYPMVSRRAPWLARHRQRSIKSNTRNRITPPDELIEDRALSFEEKLDALRIWEQDARQMLTASGEGMPGSEEGTDRNDHPTLGQVERAKDILQRSAKPAVSRGRA